MHESSRDIAVPESSIALHVAENWVGRIVVVTASGDLDSLTAPQLAAAIRAAQGKNAAAVIVDLTGVKFLASAGMNLLLAAHRATKRAVRFGVVVDGARTLRLLTLAGIDTEIALYGSLDDGLGALSDV